MYYLHALDSYIIDPNHFPLCLDQRMQRVH